jgi:Zn-dependent peptidase ImmA (M78 family)
MADAQFKPWVVRLILDGKAEEALDLLAQNYGVAVPKLKVGLPKKHKVTAYGCYTAKDQTISLQNSDAVTNPFVILHEFYHHIRSKAVDKKHRGTERGADQFALEFIEAYKAHVL